jgi:ribonucleoside-diphosphate reductase alpha chain
MPIIKFDCGLDALVSWLQENRCPFAFSDVSKNTLALTEQVNKQEQMLSELLKEVDHLADSLEESNVRAGKAEKEVTELLSPSAKRPPPRFILPDERRSFVHEFYVGGTPLGHGSITVGLYPDTDDVGEIFIKMAVGSHDIFSVSSEDPKVLRLQQQVSDLAWFLRGILDQLAISVSVGLQRGIPLDVYVDKFVHTRFPPDGITRNEDIPRCTSIVDYLFRWLSYKFLGTERA